MTTARASCECLPRRLELTDRLASPQRKRITVVLAPGAAHETLALAFAAAPPEGGEIADEDDVSTTTGDGDERRRPTSSSSSAPPPAAASSATTSMTDCGALSAVRAAELGEVSNDLFVAC